MILNKKGFSLAETLVALFVISLIMLAVVTFVQSALRSTTNNMDKDFAVQKSISILEELKALAQRAQQDGAGDTTLLDEYDDGLVSKPNLTIQDVSGPADPISGNVPFDGTLWRYERQITVTRLPGVQSADMRYVNVKVFINEKSGKRLLSEVAGVIQTLAVRFAPTQVYDIYLLAIENVPGWWVYMSNLVPFVESAVQNLQGRHPGLEFRTHWIRKLSYGRDQQYMPFINEANDSVVDINQVYFYPGLMPPTDSGYFTPGNVRPVDFYYPPSFFTARVNVDNTPRNDYDEDTNPWPYALADNYNHAMRYPDELALFNQRVASSLADETGLETDDAPTFRILLERMFRNPEQYRNAIFINLHGELFPFPPVRNYSDPAKDPEDHSGIRVVTHPEKLRYTNGDDLVLRVYTYRTDDLTPNFLNDVPATVVLNGINWTPNSTLNSKIESIEGGYDVDSDGFVDDYEVEIDDTPSADDMWYSVSPGTDTVIRLHNSPLRTPEVCDTGSPVMCEGLADADQLYDIDYIPSPVENVPDADDPFSKDLTFAEIKDSQTPRNTARWIITIPAASLPNNSMITIDTRIGEDLTTGVMWPPANRNKPANLSRTYVWRGDDNWIFGDGTPANPPNLPITERYQFQGDPRHLPYADLKMAHQGSGLAATSALGMGYNRYFDDFHDGAVDQAVAVTGKWPGWTYISGGQTYGVESDGDSNNDGWHSGTVGEDRIEADMHRVFQVLRTVIQRVQAVYTTMTGFSYYYIGFGNEIGYDPANLFNSSIPISRKPFDGGSGKIYEDSIRSDGSGGHKYIRENTGTHWWGMNWLGELYPDTMYTDPNGWAAKGNLPSGSGSNTFIRTRRDLILGGSDYPGPTGTSAFFNANRRTQAQGSTTMFWSGSAASTFHHMIQNNTTGDLAVDGTEVLDNFKYPLPNTVPLNRPFNTNVNNTAMNPDHFLQPVYGSIMNPTRLGNFYQHTSGNMGSELLVLQDPNVQDNVSFIVVNGISMTGESGSAFMANWSMLSLIQSFLRGGLYTFNSGANHIVQLPQLEITEPNDTITLDDPSSVHIAWDIEWLRWDEKKYSAGYPDNYSETSDLRFTVLYSKDNGSNWLYMQDDSVALPGVKPAPGLLLATGVRQYDWSTPNGQFPQANYLIRVEAYRDTLPLHYSYHQYRAYIRR